MSALRTKIPVQRRKIGITANHRRVQSLSHVRNVKQCRQSGLEVTADFVRRVGIRLALVIGANALRAADEVDHVPRHFPRHLGSEHDISQELTARRRPDFLETNDPFGAVTGAIRNIAFQQSSPRAGFLPLLRRNLASERVAGPELGLDAYHQLSLCHEHDVRFGNERADIRLQLGANSNKRLVEFVVPVRVVYQTPPE
jgi:hypothetical protein